MTRGELAEHMGVSLAMPPIYVDRLRGYESLGDRDRLLPE
jgi:hypothetical protein